MVSERQREKWQRALNWALVIISENRWEKMGRRDEKLIVRIQNKYLKCGRLSQSLLISVEVYTFELGPKQT